MADEIISTEKGYSVAGMANIPQGQRRIKLIASVVIKGFPGVQKGESITVPALLANELIVHGWAEEVMMVEQEAASAQVQTREPIAENRDPEVLPETPPDKSSKRKMPKKDE